jgi:4-amino-4-deoxy-L-arabinose transferase-like glycosyltransferase
MKRWSLDNVLGLLALLTFAATRLIGLAQYPIYFFTDEAANTVLAAEFLDNGFRDQFGQLFPTYFQNGPSISLSTSVYAQVVPYLLFGKSVFVTRAVPALIALTGALAMGLIFKHIFKSRWWWISILLLSLTPAWFLHSRTAFEHTLWVSFFAWFLYFYLRYRTDQPKHLITAIVFGALSFYSYNGGQLGIVIMALLLLIVDWRYHLRQRRIVLIAFGVALVCALPYARFQITHGTEASVHLQLLGSYWMQDLPLGEKLSRAVQEYAYGLRPDYWLAPDNPRDLIRHQLKGYGNLLWVTLPFAVLGLVITVKNVFRSEHPSTTQRAHSERNAVESKNARRSAQDATLAPAYRVVLLALLIAPIGGVLVQANVLRDLIMVIPTTLLTAIGLAAVLERIVQFATRRGLQRAFRVVAIITCAVLVCANFLLLNDALTNGSTWYDNYGLTGLQYGAPQVFTAIGDILEREPQTDVWLFPSWLNGSEMLRRYFLPNDPRVHLLDFDGFLADKFDLTDQTLLVMDRANYQRLIDSSKFVETQITQTIPLPAGSPGFYLLHARYAPDIDARLARERAAQEQLTRQNVIVGRESWSVAHSPQQSGLAQDLFDNNPDTYVVTRHLNPIVIDITLPEPQRVTGLSALGDGHDLNLLAELYADGASQAGRYESTFHQLHPGVPVDVEFDPLPGLVRRVRLTLTDLDQNASGSVTLRDLVLFIDQ